MKLVLAIALFLSLHAASFAQVSPKRPEFKVASVKRATSANPQAASGTKPAGEGSVSVTGDQASYEGITLKQLLMIAYDLKASQISGPGWIETERYDIVATIPKDSPKEEIPGMLQKLLSDSFQISQHMEKKEEPIYLLHIGKDGPKLRPASSGRPQSAGPSINQAGEAQMRYIGYGMADFASALSNQLGRSVTDETGLTGKFDILLPVDAKDLQPGSLSLPASLLTAVKSVGLKLDPGKTVMKHLVVDSAEKIPTEN